MKCTSFPRKTFFKHWGENQVKRECEIIQRKIYGDEIFFMLQGKVKNSKWNLYNQGF